MKIAANTVIWGNRVDDLPRMLDFLALQGCEGVEFSQRPEQLGDACELRELLTDRGLALVGLSGGTAHERIKYCADVLKPQYLYVDGWDEPEAHAARLAGLPLAIPSHIFKHRLADIDTEVLNHPELRVLLDVTHLTIAGDSLSDAIERWRDRLAAIRIKDWTPAYGRSFHRYGRGFVELGKGVVDFDRLFEKLRAIRYEGWLVFERGSREASPEEVVIQATRWLGHRVHRLLRKRIVAGTLAPSVHRPKTAGNRSQAGRPSRLASYSPEDENHFLETVFRVARKGVHYVYPWLAEAVGVLLKARLVILWSCSQTADFMVVVGVYPATERLGHHFFRYRGSLTRVALERQAVTTFDLSSSKPGVPYGKPAAKYEYPSLIQRLGLKNLICVPVLDPMDPHQARFVIQIVPGTPATPFGEEELGRISQFVAQAADSALDETCAIAAVGASLAAVSKRERFWKPCAICSSKLWSVRR